MADSQDIFNRIVACNNNTLEKYFIHMRVYKAGEHSVLFKSMTYGNSWESATVGVYNPWKSDGELGRTTYTIKEIKRADFYKLTATGKKVYNEAHGITA